MPYLKSVIRRFESNFKKGEGCWEWQKGKTTYGYGWFSKPYNGYAHRFAYIVYKGGIPKGMVVCHTCDNPKCVNPEHLFLGSRQDNSSDMVEKGRSSRGEKRSNAKLTEKDVLEIRAKYASGKYLYRELAEEYGVHRFNIGVIVRRVSWKHI